MGFYRSETISKHVTALYAASGDIQYLICGTGQAVLIDTGVGHPELKEWTAHLTGLPVRVLISHGHVDHAMGASAFSTVYMSPLDHGVYIEQSRASVRADYLKWMAGTMGVPLDASVLLPAPDPARFLSLEAGMRFALGGVSVETFSAPGHTPGSMAFLIPEERLLMTGDACNPYTLLFDLSVSAYRGAMARLELETRGRYDAVLLSHRCALGSADMLPSMIRLCDEVAAGDTDDIPVKAFGRDMRLARAADARSARRADGEPANLIYDNRRI